MKRLPLLVALVLLSTLATPITSPVVAQNSIMDELEETAREIERLQAEMAATEADISYWRDQVSATSGRMGAVLADLAAAEQTLEDLNLSITDTQAAVSFTELEISQKEAELEKTNAQISDTHARVVTQAVELFKQGGGQIQTVFDYESVQDAAVAVRYGSSVLAETNRALDTLEELRSQKEQQVGLIEEQKAELNGQLERLDTAQEKAEQQRVIIEETQALLQAELINQQALLQAVRTEAAYIDNELAAEEAEREQLRELLEAEQRRTGLAPDELWPPLNPTRIVSPYGPRLHPILGYTRIHAGIDLNGHAGQEIYAAASGTVIYAGPRGGYGNTVIIDHGGGMATLYAHQSSVAVSKGAEVVLGDLIGYVGSTGLSTGPHLHFEVRLNGAHTDPAPYFIVS